MKDARYYDENGVPHTVEIRYRYLRYEIYVDRERYASADDREDADDAIKDLVAYKGWTSTKPKKPKKKTSPKSLATTSEVN